MKSFNIIYTIIMIIAGNAIIFASESSSTETEREIENLEKRIHNQLEYTIEEKIISLTRPKRTQINDLVENTIQLGTLKHAINQTPTEIPLSSTRQFLIDTLESLGLRKHYTMEEKNKAKAIATELEHQKNHLRNLYENKYLNQHDKIPFEKVSNTPCYRCNFPYDMARFDKAIHDQKRITGEALLPYIGKGEQPSIIRQK